MSNEQMFPEKANTTQEVFERLGFIVLAYTDPSEWERESKATTITGDGVNGSVPDDAILRVIGPATAEEWARQCEICGDPIWMFGEDPHIGYLKVVAE